MKSSRYWPVIPVLMLAAVLMLGMPSGAGAQCGGGSGYMHQQPMGSGHMGSGQMGMYGQMGSGQMGMSGAQAPRQPDPNAGYTGMRSDNGGHGAMMGSGDHGQMMNQGNMGSDHSGHMQH